MSPITRSAACSARRGFTLIEIMVSLTLLGIVAGALLTTVISQQRFYLSAAEIIEMRDNLRQAGDLLPMELRGVAPAVPGEITAMLDTALEFRAPTGASVVCTVSLARTTITIPPLALAVRSGLTTWMSPPVQGDSLFILDPNGALADVYRGHAITSNPSVGSCPQAPVGFTNSVAEANAGVQLSIFPPLSATTPVGVPIRFVRRVRYSLYRSAADMQWYLGYRDFVGTRAPQWSSIQPVSGPFLPYAAGGLGGLNFTYRDSLGTAITALIDANRVRRVEMMVRAQSRTAVRTSGLSKKITGYYRDSVNVTIALRNRP
ncbi:MAG: prepilin-type N-terminal cleavage/methylation domain-containing protein [Anaerolineae bacterium]|nr:prepilin-type N-terminal cleavage/methylation domain-containing protein [Gemmatimonadaceae bacterium]